MDASRGFPDQRCRNSLLATARIPVFFLPVPQVLITGRSGDNASYSRLSNERKPELGKPKSFITVSKYVCLCSRNSDYLQLPKLFTL